MSKNHRSSKRKRSTSVPGQALGYSLQFTRLTHLLITSPVGSFVSFEVFEDVGVEAKGGKKTFIQSKSALTSNPVSDRSVPFWKTLANWAEALASGEFDFKSVRLIIYVSRPAGGNLVRLFHAAKSPEDATVALQTARQELLVNSHDSEGSRPHMDRFFNLSPEIQSAVILAFELDCGSGSPHADLEEEIRSRWVPAERVDVVANHICGLVKRKVDKLLEQQKPAILSRDEFHRETLPVVRKYAERAMLHSFAPAPSTKESEAFLPKVFVQQLRIIEKGIDDQMQAVSDFFRATNDRTMWGKSGDVDEASLNELDGALMAAWKNLKSIAVITAAQQGEVTQGQLLFAHCMQHQTSLEGLQLPSHFVPGCFHMLSDGEKVGWHPNYLVELKRRKEGE